MYISYQLSNLWCQSPEAVKTKYLTKTSQWKHIIQNGWFFGYLQTDYASRESSDQRCVYVAMVGPCASA